MTGEAVPANVVTTYGMTETSGGCVYNGVPLLGVKVAVEPDGRILLAGPMLAEGYADGDTSAWTVRDGFRWLRTSDSGELRDGVLSVWGRLDDVINTGGFKVHPATVERELSTLAYVAEAVVAPVPDAQWGQRVVAVIEVADGEALPPLAELRAALAARLEPHQLPRELIAVEQLPRLAHGKIDRRAVHALLAD